MPELLWINVNDGPQTDTLNRLKHVHIARTRKDRRRNSYVQYFKPDLSTSKVSAIGRPHLPLRSQLGRSINLGRKQSTPAPQIRPKYTDFDSAIKLEGQDDLSSDTGSSTLAPTATPSTSDISIDSDRSTPQEECIVQSYSDQSDEDQDGILTIVRNTDTIGVPAALGQSMDPFRFTKMVRQDAAFAEYMASNSVAFYSYATRFCEILMAHCYPLETLEMGTWLWLNATVLAPLLPISLAFGAAHLITTSSEVPKDVYQHISTLRSWALVALNKYVADVTRDPAKSGDDSETAMVVGGFLAFESMLGRPPESKAHMDGLVKFSATCGGYQNFGHLVQSHMLMVDCSHSLLCASKPQFVPDPGWLSEITTLSTLDDLPEPDECAILGTAFATPSIHKHLDTNCLALLRTARQVTIYKELIDRGVRQLQLYDNDIFTVVGHGFLAALAEERLQEEGLRIQECVLQGAHMYHFSCLRPCARFPHARTAIVNFRKLLTDPAVLSLFLTTGEKEDLLLWFYWVGWYATKVGVHPDLNIWFTCTFQHMIIQMGLPTWDAVQAKLKPFLFVERLSGHAIPDMFK